MSGVTIWNHPHRTPRRAPRLVLVLGLSSVLLAGCGDTEIKHATVAVNNTTSGALFWYDAKATDLIVVTGDDGQGGAASMAKALAWPDRLVIMAPPDGAQTCSALVAQAVKAAQDFAARTHRPAPSAPVLVGLDGDSAMAFSADPGTVEARAVVAFNYCPTSPAPRPACAPSTTTAATPVDVPIIAIPDTSRCTADDVHKTLGGFADARAITPAGGAIDLVSAVVSQVMGNVADRADDGELDLPLVELPAEGKNAKKDDRLAIIISGDGGWADIDRQVGEELSKRGVAVVGLDALKYFWRKKEPAEAAADVTRIIDHYTTAWSRRRVVLLGYSFGADIIPFMWPYLSAATRAKVSHMGLLALSPDASFEITVGGWVGVESREAVPTAPAVKQVSGAKVFCVQAGDDDEDPCPTLGVDAISMPGDHHFDRDYKKLSGLILSRTANP